jgi:hypothetical protein
VGAASVSPDGWLGLRTSLKGVMMGSDPYAFTDDDDDAGSADSGNRPDNGLRKFSEKMQAENKKLQDQLNALLSEKRTHTVREVFRAKGVNEKIAAFYPSSGEVTTEAVDKWLTDNDGIFVASTKDTPDPKTTSDVPDDLRKAMQAVQDATPTGGSVKTLDQEAAEIDRLKMDSQADRERLDAWNGKLQGMARELVRNRYNPN